MKLLSEIELQTLMTKHLFLLSEEEIKALAFTLGLKITHYKKNGIETIFYLTQESVTVSVNCRENRNIWIGKIRKTQGGLNQRTSFGGCFTFADLVKCYRTYFRRRYTLTVQSSEASVIYGPHQFQKIALAANDLVENAMN